MFLMLKFLTVASTFVLLRVIEKISERYGSLISTTYIFLATIFALGVVIYDIAVICGIDVSPVNAVAHRFFQLFKPPG